LATGLRWRYHVGMNRPGAREHIDWPGIAAGLMARIRSRFPWLPPEELEESAWATMGEAWATWRPERGSRLGGWVWAIALKRLPDDLARKGYLSPRREIVEADLPRPLEDPDEYGLDGFPARDDRHEDPGQILRDVSAPTPERPTPALTNRELLALELRHVDGLTLAELATVFAISRPRMGQVIRRAERLARRCLRQSDRRAERRRSAVEPAGVAGDAAVATWPADD